MTQSKTFVLTGAAGYIAPRHLQAIKANAGCLRAALDPHDSVGILDSFNPEAQFFTEPERFDRFLYKNRGRIDYMSICVPNHLHDAHCRMALRNHVHAICEKPLALRPWNVDQLIELEEEFGRHVYVVLQMRLHPGIIALRDWVKGRPDVRCKVHYVTRRGDWYQHSWKGDIRKSGGVTMNLGIHFFDTLGWLFGEPTSSEVHAFEPRRARGLLRFQRATAEWFISSDASDLPPGSGFAHRVFEVDGRVADASQTMTSSHDEVYRQVLAGTAPRAADARLGVQIVHQINQDAAP